MADDRQSGSSASPDDLIALAQQYSSETTSIPSSKGQGSTLRASWSRFHWDSLPESAKAAYASFRGSHGFSEHELQNSQSRLLAHRLLEAKTYIDLVTILYLLSSHCVLGYIFVELLYLSVCNSLYRFREKE
ncbi:uncharacterized protein LOC130993320 [Salvia miltiorrhiza]|uniref:uncharacterized protein LOC130993320 n=1 Tax=Salvia miltiorrhiza TaxID=226208 RepID=UPI0025AB5E3C|nr:uncharacterized protein LOC130993320 [Salvia miltiorrhiza]